MMRPLRDMALAITQLTFVPMPVAWPEDAKPDVAGWYPLVGALLGSLGWLVLSLNVGSALLRAAILVALIAVITRGLHWDGLADVSDAWHVQDGERRRAVMKDSATGAFGTLAVVLVVVLQVASLSLLAEKGAGAVLVIGAVAGRFSASFSAWFGTPASDAGLGASVSRSPGASSLLGVLVAFAFVGGVFFAGVGEAAGRAIAAGSLVGLFLALGVPHMIARRFGGTNGDTMGASIIVVESAVLLVSALSVSL